MTWSAEDQEFVATCAEFPSLSWLAPSQVDAFQGLQALLADVIADMEERGEEVPLPFAERSYSGKFQVRMGESQHRALAKRAAQDGVSLNQYVVRKLADIG
ncbi:type II toxin-antitoxin system HicB family antitoxin [Actinoplanes sp. GCM10030250]